MRSHGRAAAYRSDGSALLRAAALSRSALPPWPDFTGSAAAQPGSWVAWLRSVWVIGEVAEAIEHASPDLARQVRALCDSKTEPSARVARRAAVSVARYLQRAAGRPTPFGLLAGVAPATLAGTGAEVHWGTKHTPVVHAGAHWLAAVIARMQRCPDLLARLPVIANSQLSVRGDRLIVPHRPGLQRGTALEISLRHTAPLRAAIENAAAPIRFADLAEKVLAAFPAARPAKAAAMLTGLVEHGALITSLHAPSTRIGALAHLLSELGAVDADTVEGVAALAGELRLIHDRIESQRHKPVGGRAARDYLARQMHCVASLPQNPLAVDLRLDANVALPAEVAREAERAASVLARVSAYPYGTSAWRSYHQRFYERFGRGAMVPLLDVVADSGVGWPDGYPGTATPEARSPLSSRDEALLALAQRAALDRQHEIELDEATLTAITLGGDEPRLPPHLELAVRVHAADLAALRRGEFRIEVVSVSRGAGVMTGRFLHVLDEDHRAPLARSLAAVPGNDQDTLPAQLSFPPLDPATAHVARAAQVLPVVISLAEHRPTGPDVLTPADLAVGCDGRRMYLAAPARGRRVEAVGMHALNLRLHTPPLARFLTELGRAHCAQVTVFDWGAARTLPFLPRLRYGRAILTPARWRLDAADLPARIADWNTWDGALAAWRERRRAPRWVQLTEGDQRLPLDLDDPQHRALLRAHLNTAPHAVLTEAPEPSAAGWCGGRPHEVIVPLTATEPPAWPRLPKPSTARVIRADHGHSPAASPVLLASLYGDLQRQNVILAEHLPDLLAQFDTEPAWWFVRFRDPDQHLRIRLALPHADSFGAVAAVVSTWADGLRRAGLLRDIRYPASYPETGRWGSGPVWDAAEDVFRADSRAVLATLSLRQQPDRLAVLTAHAVSIAGAFTGSTAAGMRWLITNVPAAAPAPIARPVFGEAVRLADPRDNWQALRAAPGGAAIATAWADRDRALAHYRACFGGPDTEATGTHSADTEGVDTDDVLGSLLHVSFVRGHAIDFGDEAQCLYLARAAALAWTARTNGSHP